MPDYLKKPIETLNTPRLVLRPLKESDSAKVQELFPHWNVLKYMAAAIPWPYPEDGAISFWRTIQPKIEKLEEYYWAITLNGDLIGVIGLSPAAEEDSRGFWLAERHWQKGYMTEAVAAVNDFAFDTLKMEYMLLNNAEPNVGSHKLKERSGAQIIRIDEANYVSGKFPQIRWKLTAASWRAHRTAFLNRE